MIEKMPPGERLMYAAERLRVKIRFFIGRRLPPRETKTEPLFNGCKIPICPRCGELVYFPRQCTSCGQRFRGETKTVGEVIDIATTDI